MSFSSADLDAVMPLLVLAGGSCILLLLDLFRSKTSPLRLPMFRVGLPLAVCFATWVSLSSFLVHQDVATGALIYHDTYTYLFSTILLLGTALTILLNHEQLEAQRMRVSADIDVLLLLATLGGIVMVAAANLIVLFIGFELLSVAVYALTGTARMEKASAEGSLKYFLLGAFSSTFLLYGMALIYGATGSMLISEIVSYAPAGNVLYLIGIGLIIFGFGFKVSLVPFHFWTPDVYQGAPASIAGYMAVVVKTAAFGSFLRVMLGAFGHVGEIWTYAIWCLAIITMTFGNLVALRQKSLKRMLAYSSIAHAGYALMGFLAFEGGPEATSFYLLVYTLMTIAAFGVVLAITGDSEAQYGEDDISSLSGIGWSHPVLGVVMSVAVLSLAGIPPLAGFIGKLYLFSAVLEAGYLGLVIVAALNSVVSLYYYLGILVVMYFPKEREVNWSPRVAIPFSSSLALFIATAGTLYLGIFASRYLEFAKFATDSLG